MAVIGLSSGRATKASPPPAARAARAPPRLARAALPLGRLPRRGPRRVVLDIIFAPADDRYRQALALARGGVARVALCELREACRGQRVRGSLFGDALMDQVVAGVLQQ